MVRFPSAAAPARFQAAAERTPRDPLELAACILSNFAAGTAAPAHTAPAPHALSDHPEPPSR
ncbi:hypothetical protein SAMN02745121_08620 [Nannocystis exedens]|uniref:Uncharacterized protein n=1 Tax=Nannocystis exedens TaxID=54 RepID=A0A1I2ICK0_9BACT|nr:hypothetical protein [Nannocystis exedens]PCC67161.1 hypothetical protein NAEX_00164 [Nannocystis exedens]SFF40072.1 hypothetical protein SAMN02745121_08620 [Nannocystis exedens]